MDSRAHLEKLTRGFMPAAVILTANNLGVFDALDEGPRSAAALAESLRLDARALEIVLLALAAEGILEHADGEFRLASEYADYLLSRGPQTQHNILNHNFNLLRRWAGLAEVLRAGKPIARDREGDGEKDMRSFICGMADISRTSSIATAEVFDFSPFRRLLDLGGGPATHSITFARKHPNLHCVVLDLEGPVSIAREQISAAGLEDRVSAKTGDLYRDDYGDGFDIVFISNIIHMMGPEDTEQMFRKSAAALVPGGCILVKDFFLDDDRVHPAHAAMFSVNMLVNTDNGKSYTLSETQELLRRAGFKHFGSKDVAQASRLLWARLPA